MNKAIFLLMTCLFVIHAEMITLSPLSAILKDKNIKNAVVRISPKDKSGIPLVYEASDKTIKKYGGVPIFGLYEDFDNTIDIKYKQGSETKNDTYHIQTQKIGNNISDRVNITKYDNIFDSSKFDKRMYFILDEDSAFIIDALGYVRWYANIDKMHFIDKPNDRVLIFGNMAFDIVGGRALVFNVSDNTRFISAGGEIFRVNGGDIIRLDKAGKTVDRWKFPFAIDVFNDISSLYNGLFVGYKDSVIKLGKKSEIEWILGGEDSAFVAVDARGDKITCEDCKGNRLGGKVGSVQEIGFLRNKDIIYIIAFGPNANIYKLDLRLRTSEILWEYEIDSEILGGSAAYMEDLHSIFIGYKDINRDLNMLEFLWGQSAPRVHIKVDEGLEAMPFSIDWFLK